MLIITCSVVTVLVPKFLADGIMVRVTFVLVSLGKRVFILGKSRDNISPITAILDTVPIMGGGLPILSFTISARLKEKFVTAKNMATPSVLFLVVEKLPLSAVRKLVGISTLGSILKFAIVRPIFSAISTPHNVSFASPVKLDGK